MKFWEKIKKAFKPNLDELENKIEEQDQSLESTIKNMLDINKDGKLNKADFSALILKFIDVDGSGDVDIWEYIGLFVRARKILKKLKQLGGK